MKNDVRILVVGMAGGIGSGKSLVASMLGEMGATVFDADAINHEVLRSPDVVDGIRRRWGQDVLDERGQVDRRKLGAKVFQEESQVRELERIVHPEVIARIRKEIDRRRLEGPSGVTVIDAPLLFEAGLDRMCDFVVFVEAPEVVRRERVREKRNWDEKEVARRERHQKSLSWKRDHADSVIENTRSVEEVRRQVEALWTELSRRVSP